LFNQFLSRSFELRYLLWVTSEYLFICGTVTEYVSIEYRFYIDIPIVFPGIAENYLIFVISTFESWIWKTNTICLKIIRTGIIHLFHSFPVIILILLCMSPLLTPSLVLFPQHFT
jgi:hypothetical protein